MAAIPKTYTLNVETIEQKSGIWLCLDDGFTAIPLAQFLSEQTAEQFKQALNIAAMKAHAMGKSGI